MRVLYINSFEKSHLKNMTFSMHSIPTTSEQLLKSTAWFLDDAFPQRKSGVDLKGLMFTSLVLWKLSNGVLKRCIKGKSTKSSHSLVTSWYFEPIWQICERFFNICQNGKHLPQVSRGEHHTLWRTINPENSLHSKAMEKADTKTVVGGKVEGDSEPWHLWDMEGFKQDTGLKVWGC